MVASNNRVGFRVDGLSAVVRALESMGLQVTDLKDAFAEIATQGARQAAMYAPHRTGRLARDVRGHRAKSKAVVSAGRANRVPYAGAINYGWAAHNIEPALFMQRADKEMQPFAIKRLEEEINKQIKKRGL